MATVEALLESYNLKLKFNLGKSDIGPEYPVNDFLTQKGEVAIGTDVRMEFLNQQLGTLKYTNGCVVLESAPSKYSFLSLSSAGNSLEYCLIGEAREGQTPVSDAQILVPDEQNLNEHAEGFNSMNMQYHAGGPLGTVLRYRIEISLVPKPLHEIRRNARMHSADPGASLTKIVFRP